MVRCSGKEGLFPEVVLSSRDTRVSECPVSMHVEAQMFFSGIYFLFFMI